MVKRRNMITQIILMIVTFGLYGVYWFYQTAKELKAVTQDAEAAPVLWTILFFVPFAALYSLYAYAKVYTKVCTEKLSVGVLFLIGLIFYPALWFLVQTDLNAIADKKIQSN